MISLTKACLNTIVQEFDRFHLAFSTSNDETLNLRFEFLQRAYTFELISELSEESKLKDEYLNFLLNVHLKSLDEEWFIDSCYRKTLKDIICRLPNLAKVKLQFICNDEILENIAKSCPLITEIDAACSTVTDTGLEYLCKIENEKVPCPNLKNILINATFVTDEGVKLLIQTLQSLKKIEYENFPEILYFLHKKDLHNLGCVPTYKFVHLKIWNSRLTYCTDLLKICLTLCPKVKSIEFFMWKDYKEQLDLFKCTALEELKLKSNVEINVNNFLKINGCNLVTLCVSNCIISVNILSSSCPNLQYLDMDDCAFSDDADDSECSFNCLIRCSLTYTDDYSPTKKSMRLLLSSSPNLEDLTFDICKLSSETKTQILKCCEQNVLKNIEFSSTPVDVSFVKDILLNSPSLKTLTLNNCFYTINEKKEITGVVKALTTKSDVYVDYISVNDYELPERKFLDYEPQHIFMRDYTRYDNLML